MGYGFLFVFERGVIEWENGWKIKRDGISTYMLDYAGDLFAARLLCTIPPSVFEDHTFVGTEQQDGLYITQ